MEALRVLRYVKKWFWLIVLASFIGGTAGLVVSLLQPKLYEADTILYISSPNHTDYQSVLGDQQAAKAFASIPQSDSVLAATIRAVGGTNLNLSQLSSMVTVTNNVDTQFVTIGVRSTDPKLSGRLAKEIAEQSINQFEAVATNGAQTKPFLQQELVSLESEIKDLEKQLIEARSQSGLNTPSLTQTGSIDQLNTHLSADRTLYNELLNSYASLSTTQVTVVQDARLLPNPVGLGKTLAAAIGTLVGLITIVGVIILIEQTDNILRTPDKISRATGLSTLMTVAYLPAIAKQPPQLNSHHEVTENNHHEITGDTDTVKLTPAMVKQARLLARHGELTEDMAQEAIDLVGIPKTPWIEDHQDNSEDTVRRLPKVTKQASVASVRSNVKNKALNEYQLLEEFLALGILLSDEGGQLTSKGSHVGSLLITSPDNGDGKTLIASQVALGLARVGIGVVLVDANLHNPRVHNVFELSNRIGLSSILTGSIKVEPNFISDVLQKTQQPNLTILPCGPVIDSPSALLSSSRMTAILNQLSQEAFVVIDSPAVLTSSDAVILAKKCDRILMVVDARHTTATKLDRSLGILTRISVNILGVILNRAGN